jgi:hypothetical protein
MLKALALTLMVATFLASGFSLAPAEDWQGLKRTEIFESYALAIVPSKVQIMSTSEFAPAQKTGREDKPNS